MSKRRKSGTIPLVLVAVACLAAAPGDGQAAPAARPFLRGADISFLPQVEAGGGVFRVRDEARDPLLLLRICGFNAVRLRLWHAPGDGHNGLAETLRLARRAGDAGYDLLLDLHYSDSWADPGHQTPPAAWSGLGGPALADSVRAYTAATLAAFAAQGTPPDIVQLGNEISQGMLWDTGRVGGSYDTPGQWHRLGSLLRAGLDGVRDALPGDQRPEVMFHIDRSADIGGARWFYDHLAEQGLDFDLIGVSYYPWWHGPLARFRATLSDLAVRYGKDIVVVETAYPWTTEWFDRTHNLVGPDAKLLPEFSPTPQGQRDFLAAVRKIVRDLPEGHGRGVFYWAPAWISTPRFGSGWENMTLFDNEGRPLPALRQ